MEKINFLIAVISVLSDIASGIEFEEGKDLLEFRQYITDNGYNADMVLEEWSICEALHFFCSEFASVPIVDIKKEFNC